MFICNIRTVDITCSKLSEVLDIGLLYPAKTPKFSLRMIIKTVMIRVAAGKRCVPPMISSRCFDNTMHRKMKLGNPRLSC